jgi:predicted  nucleic acid-binding Zn-ribbon protein
MSTQASWQRIRNEFTRLTDVEQLKNEVHRIGNELRKFDFHAVLSPSAQARVKMFERRYAELMRTMQTAQRQVDREFNKVLKQVKTRRGTVEKVLAQQKDKLNTLRKKFTAGSAKMKKNASKRATTKTRSAGAKKRRK